MPDIVNGYYIVQDGAKFFVALQLACDDDDGKRLTHLLVIGGPFESYDLADRKRKGENV
jgi:hypothetical protein